LVQKRKNPQVFRRIKRNLKNPPKSNTKIRQMIHKVNQNQTSQIQMKKIKLKPNKDSNQDIRETMNNKKFKNRQNKKLLK
jgi:hypothetical protein